MKSKVFANKLRTIEALEANITRFIREIPVEMLERVVENLVARMGQLKRSAGQHLKEIIFKQYMAKNVLSVATEQLGICYVHNLCTISINV